MAYSTTNPPYLLVPRAAGGAGAFWGYNSTNADTLGTIATTGYFSDAFQRGMKANDFIIVTATTAFGIGKVVSVSSTAGTVLTFASSST